MGRSLSMCGPKGKKNSAFPIHFSDLGMKPQEPLPMEEIMSTSPVSAQDLSILPPPSRNLALVNSTWLRGVLHHAAIEVGPMSFWLTSNYPSLDAFLRSKTHVRAKTHVHRRLNCAVPNSGCPKSRKIYCQLLLEQYPLGAHVKCN